MELEARQNVQSVYVSSVAAALSLLGSWEGSAVGPFHGMKHASVLTGRQPCRATQHSLLEMPSQVAGTARVVGFSLS